MTKCKSKEKQHITKAKENKEQTFQLRKVRVQWLKYATLYQFLRIQRVIYPLCSQFYKVHNISFVFMCFIVTTDLDKQYDLQCLLIPYKKKNRKYLTQD